MGLTACGTESKDKRTPQTELTETEETKKDEVLLEGAESGKEEKKNEETTEEVVQTFVAKAGISCEEGERLPTMAEFRELDLASLVEDEAVTAQEEGGWYPGQTLFWYTSKSKAGPAILRVKAVDGEFKVGATYLDQADLSERDAEMKANVVCI